MTEGLIRTYPIESAIKYIADYYKLDKSQYQVIEGENGVKCVVIIVPNIGENGKIIEGSMSGLCGYFCSTKEVVDGWLLMQFEPKFTETTEVTKYIYHMTPTYNVDKIKKIGITPKAKNVIFNYPSRIYFWKDGDDDGNVLNLVAGLFYAVPNVKKNEGYTLITVDTDRLKDVKFYNDSNFADGVFTYNNIPPSAIVKTEEINLDLIKK